MKTFLSFIILLILQTHVFAATDIAHPFHFLAPEEVEVTFRSGFFREEHEYEKAKVVQDLFKYKHYAHKIALLTPFLTSFSGKRQIGFEIAFNDHGRLTKMYSPSTGFPNESFTYKGFQYLEIFYQEYLKTKDEKSKMALELRLKGSPLNGKETNNTAQGKDFAISFLYSYDHNEWRVFGKLTSEVIGRKKIQKFDGNREVINTYSKFGNRIGFQWLQNKYWFETSGHFALTTDYNSRSSNYNRLTDKGFGLGAKFLLGIHLTPELILTLDHSRESLNFNVITEVFAESTEFEIEKDETQLGVTWLF
jgi:hypothetical protein